MAKKKTKKKATTTRRKTRRKIGAVNADSKQLLVATAGGVVGVVIAKVAGNLLKNVAVKNFPTMEAYADYIVGAAQFGAGYVLPKIVKQQSPFLKGVQLGMCITGGSTVIMATGALDSIKGIASYLVPSIAGTDKMLTYNNRQLAETRSQPVAMVAGMNRKQALKRRASIAMHA